MSRKLILVFCFTTGLMCGFTSLAQRSLEAADPTLVDKLDSVLKPLILQHPDSLQRAYASPFCPIFRAVWYERD